MAAEDRRDRTGLGNLSGLGAVLVLVAGAVWYPLLDGQRPAQRSAGLRAVSMQDVDARLWQDPFGAVQKARKAKTAHKSNQAASAATPAGKLGKQDRHSAEFLAKEIRRASDSGPVVVLGVMVFGENSVGADEHRRRTRYAVLSSLMSAAYAPQDPEHIGYIEMRGHGRNLPRFVPYEWFHKDSAPSVVVLWLDQNSLLELRLAAEKPSERYSLHGLSQVLEKAGAALDNVRINVIGPAGSDFLQRMHDELTEFREAKLLPHELPRLLDRIAFFSPFATLSEAALCAKFKPQGSGEGDGATCGSDELFEAQEHRVGLRRFVRVNSPDDKVIGALFDELKARRIDSAKHIAIVGELDTQYARELADSIAKRAVDASQGELPKTVHLFGYMRGIDGRLPETGPAPAEAKKPSENSRERPEVERPEGDAQVDYLRRLAGQMKDRERALAASLRHTRGWWEGELRFGAIGVVGNDYYDKLLILQALRPVFPEAIFFTTDLYAAMLHPTDNKATRNVIVGSGFGLALHPALQDGTPPFRDSYQSAAYLAVKVSLSADDLEAEQLHKRAASWQRPRVWEVGRTRLHDLSASPAAPAGPCDENPLRCDSPFEANERLIGLQWGPVLWTAASFAAFLLFAFPELRRGLWTALRRKMSRLALIAAVGVTAGLSALAVVDALSPEGEPFAWFEGVSIWPSLLLRLVALYVALGALWYAYRSFRTRAEETEAEFFPRGASKAGDAPEPERAWAHYRDAMSGKKVALMALGELLLLLLFLASLMSFSGPRFVPTRSTISHALEFTLVLATVLPSFYLLISVAVAVRRTNRLADLLAGAMSWRDEVRGKYGLPVNGQIEKFDEWLNLNVIARQSEGINRLIYFPFLVLFLTMLARNGLFDNWSMPPALMVVLTLSFTYLIASAVRLRLNAERARRNALKTLQEKLIVLEGSDDASADRLGKQCKLLIERVQKLSSGAFLPFTQQPVVRAILTVAGALSGAALLEYAALANF